MSKNNYFKGWYFKCCGKNKTIAFIPAYHRSDGRETASLQVITDEAVFNIPFASMKYTENIKNEKLTIIGELQFFDISPIKYDIMGPFSIVPFMQCRHSVYSMKHLVNGQIIVNGKMFDFENGSGYIEGDRGSSFPDRYIWTQCCFGNGSLMLSVADIPLSGFRFTGIIGVVLLDKKEYRIATYLGAKVKHIEDNTVTVCQGGYELTAKLIKKNAQPLYAPVNGAMNRVIHESASCTAQYKFSRKGETLCEFTSNIASFEFEYDK